MDPDLATNPATARSSLLSPPPGFGVEFPRPVMLTRLAAGIERRIPEDPAFCLHPPPLPPCMHLEPPCSRGVSPSAPRAPPTCSLLQRLPGHVPRGRVLAILRPAADGPSA